MASEILERKERETLFLKNMFGAFYLRQPPAPSEISSREFGFGNVKKIDFRHKAFSSAGELQTYLSREAPLFASYSIARYRFPAGRPMEKKEPLGYDLVFDLDASPLHEGHNKILCQHCIEQTQKDAARLLEDFLLSDFGFSKSDVAVNFSGSKGFHFHVETKAVQELPQAQRAQIIDYVSAQSLDPEKVFHKRFATKSAQTANIAKEVFDGPSQNALGWHKKIFEGFKAALGGEKEGLLDLLKSAGCTAKEANLVFENREEILREMQAPLANDGRYGNWGRLPHLKELSKKIVEKLRVSQSVPTDRAVTYDLSRLIRLPDSIHGDTGLLAKKTPNLGEFDAQKGALAFSMKQKISIVPKDKGKVLLGEEEFEFFENEEFDAPEALAVLLLCKNAAVLKE
ncbi:MAG: DNA primase small subunit domain-containing protein [Candidatus Micrarchaeia archaeon]|jgi:DNA primase small subunit